MIDSRAPTQGGSTGIREILRVVNRRKIIILAPTVLVAGIAWAMASVTVPRFTATAAVTLGVGKVHIVDREIVTRLPLESSTLRSEIDIMRSRALNEEVVIQLGLGSDPGVAREASAWRSPWPELARIMLNKVGRVFPGIIWNDPADAVDTLPTSTRPQLVDWLIGNLIVSNDGRSLTIVVSFTSENPERAALIANAVAQTHLDDQVLIKNRATMAATKWLGERVAKIREQLEVSEAAVDDFRRNSGLLQVKGETITAQRLSDLNAQLGNARAERTRAEVRLQTARESGPETLPDVVASSTLQSLRRELAQLNAAILENRDHSTFYKLRILDERAAAVRQQMSQEMNRILAGLAGEVQIARKREAELTQAFRVMDGHLGGTVHFCVRHILLQCVHFAIYWVTSKIICRD